MASKKAKVIARVEPSDDAPPRLHRATPIKPLPTDMRKALVTCIEEARHRGQYGPVAQMMRELRAVEEEEARNGTPPSDGALDELTRRS